VAEYQAVEKRFAGFRLAIWLVALMIGWVFFRGKYPLAWQVAAFGAGFTSLFAFALRPKPTSQPAVTEGSEAPSEMPTEQTPLTGSAFPRTMDIGVDLIVVIALTNVTDGFSSPFSPLYFFPVIEAYALLGAAEAVYTALAAALLSLVHFRLGPPSLNAAVLYGVAMGTLVVTAVLVGLRQTAALLAGTEAGMPLWGNRQRQVGRSTLMKQRTVEELERQLEEQEAASRQLKATYREVAQRHREQRTQIERLRTAEQLFEASAAPIANEDAAAAYTRLLHILTDALEAGGAALWLRERQGDTLSVQAMVGRVAPLLRDTPIPRVAETPPGELRALCEERLLASAPVSPARKAPPAQASGTAEGAEPETEAAAGNSAARPVLVALLRATEEDGANVGAIIGAVGVCDPRGAARFSPSDAETLQALAAPFSAALANVEQRRRLQRRVREISLLYDLSRLVQTATDMNQVYNAVVAQVQQIIPCENCTLFLLDPTRSRLEPKATRGRVVNLLDHIAFEKGQGVSGWVASRGKQLVIADLKQEHNLLNVEMIPPRVRSFVAVPLMVQENVIGVLNVSHSQPNAFTAEDVQLLTILAGQAAVTIERTEVFHTLETLAITDGLTQVYNHRYFQMRLEDELRRGRRYNLAVSLMLADADNFKSINDHYGHATGDKVLRELAALLRRSVRETEIVARYGGEEFALILPQTGAEQALVAAERVRANVGAATFQAADGQPIHLTVSIGIATFPTHGATRAKLIEQADGALYAAKRRGRNAVCLASALPSPQNEAQP